MKNISKILSNKKIVLLYKNNKQNLCRILRSKYNDTYLFIDKNFCYNKPNNSNNGGKNKFTEKIYKYVYGNTGICKECKKCPTTFRSFSEGYFKFCSQSCQQKNTASKYGVKNLFQSPKIKQKIKQSCLKKYGSENPMQSDIVKLKGRISKFNKYGDENYNNTKKIQQTMLSKYGVKSPAQMDGYLEKWTKSGVMKKSYTLPSGKEIKVQGYEDKALSILLKKYTEEQIFEQTPPKINYIIDGVNRVFYPDFFIKNDNLIIEVKSRFTYDRWLNKNISKKEYSEKMGYKINFWIIDKKGNLEEII